MEAADLARLRAARDKLASLGFAAELRDDSVEAHKDELAVRVVIFDELLRERNDAVLIRMPRPDDEPFRFGVHAAGGQLDAVLGIVEQTADSLLEGDPEPFSTLAKAAGLSWFVEL
jgi:hypothetical protein